MIVGITDGTVLIVVVAVGATDGGCEMCNVGVGVLLLPNGLLFNGVGGVGVVVVLWGDVVGVVDSGICLGGGQFPVPHNTAVANTAMTTTTIPTMLTYTQRLVHLELGGTRS